MSLRTSRKINKNKMNKQSESICSGEKTEKKCAGCNQKIPEYVLDDRQLCLDCYKTEICYLEKN